MAELQFLDVSKVYGRETAAVRNLSLSVGEGEFVVLVGPSGCGKTTALRMVAGLEEITDGEIRIGGRVVNDLPPRDRDIAMVFQNYALYPHKTVYENLAFGLRMRKVPKSEQRRRVEEIARVLGLGNMLQRRPAQLSGGQRQRVAMGRAIVREPKAFLMDEPLSNLDAKLRVQMRAEIARIQQTLKVTTLYVTHDQVEAMTMGHRVAVMRDGVLQQVDTPQRLYDMPVNLFVASFVGSPQMNLFEAELVSDRGSLVCRLGGAEIELPLEVTALRPNLAAFAGGAIAVGIRPEDVTLAAAGNGAVLPARVLLVEALGAEHLVHLEIAATPLRRPELVDAASQPSEAEAFGRSSTLLGRFDRSFLLQPGEAVEVAIDPHRLHFFELGSGTAIEAVDAPVLDRVTG
ncbi:MAG TPA: sn-glycerol-3-phosphate ABC transporter ATP-binding protein UgpC [Gaiellaceae bacterium]|jgi:multiple sugar transport system ATP-binding protein|nr:sn-glycerol-3-phosphate ABC transporter ATP-binding protein UgpC [Gaiellaceae bacterium]